MGDTRKPIGRLEVKSYRFESSFADARVSAEWGMLTVPENRRRPDTGAIELSFVRFPATTSRPGHPVLFLAGGPGQSGVEFARGSHFPLFMSLRDVGDVIALDQRGTGSSRPRLLCGSDGFRMPPDRPAVREQALDL
ncbi:MAG: hypothetical protein PVF33_13645, partial [Candidatus Latescibacterota bacterium]